MHPASWPPHQSPFSHNKEGNWCGGLKQHVTITRENAVPKMHVFIMLSCVFLCCQVAHHEQSLDMLFTVTKASGHLATTPVTFLTC